MERNIISCRLASRQKADQEIAEEQISRRIAIYGDSIPRRRPSAAREQVRATAGLIDGRLAGSRT